MDELLNDMTFQELRTIHTIIRFRTFGLFQVESLSICLQVWSHFIVSSPISFFVFFDKQTPQKPQEKVSCPRGQSWLGLFAVRSSPSVCVNKTNRGSLRDTVTEQPNQPTDPNLTEQLTDVECLCQQQEERFIMGTSEPTSWLQQIVRHVKVSSRCSTADEPRWAKFRIWSPTLDPAIRIDQTTKPSIW